MSSATRPIDDRARCPRSAAKGRRGSRCCVVGGGPAGLVLGLLLARAGVEVTVLEKHGDFLRDFRGDTVHVSTMTLLDDLGLWDRFATLPWKPVHRMRMTLDAGTVTVGDLSRLRAPHPFLAMVPQWHLLDMLAGVAGEEPTFTLLRHAEVVDLVRVDGRVRGVRWVDRSERGSGPEHVLPADLVIGCDGRRSRVREASGLPVRSYEVPMDVWWFRLPRSDSDPDGGLGRLTAGRLVIMIDRGDHYQVAYIIPRGADAEHRRQPISSLRDELRRLLPWLGDRVDALGSWDDVKLLAVTLDRLRTWSAAGVLCIGDAAHAMSPAGGVGINLAVQDAVAAARLLAPVLTSADDPVAVDRAARRVQRRRGLPTALTQAVQRATHRAALGAHVTDPESATPVPASIPPPLRLLQRIPALQRFPARLFGIGVLPERTPQWARRPGG